MNNIGPRTRRLTRIWNLVVPLFCRRLAAVIGFQVSRGQPKKQLLFYWQFGDNISIAVRVLFEEKRELSLHGLERERFLLMPAVTSVDRDGIRNAFTFVSFQDFEVPMMLARIGLCTNFVSQDGGYNPVGILGKAIDVFLVVYTPFCPSVHHLEKVFRFFEANRLLGVEGFGNEEDITRLLFHHVQLCFWIIIPIEKSHIPILSAIS